MIYILEDDNSIRELVTYTLNRSGYEAKGFDLPSLFWAEMEKQMPDLLLLDIMLPEEDGIHILKRLRANSATSQLPVIMLTAKGLSLIHIYSCRSGGQFEAGRFFEPESAPESHHSYRHEAQPESRPRRWSHCRAQASENLR